MNLKYLINQTVKKYYGRTALIYGQRRWTFGEFNNRINRLANALLGLGLAKGDRVGLLMENCPEYIETRFALEKTGLVYVPLNVLLSSHDQRYILSDAAVTAVVCTQTYFTRVAELQKDLPGLRFVVVAGAGDQVDTGSVYAYEDLLASASPLEPSADVSAEDLCSLNYTSGTTGKPKGTMLTQGNWMAVYRNFLIDRDIRADDILAHIGPLTHASGAYFMPYFLRGATNLIIEGGVNFERLFSAIQDERVTAFTTVPTVLIRMLSFPDIKNYDLSSLRNIAYGAAPMPSEKIKQAMELFGPILTQNYGLTEAYMTVCTLSKEEHLKALASDGRRLNSVGRPYTFVEVRVVGENGQDKEPGEKGELIVRSEHVMQGYWGLPGETAQVLRGGWLYTGDVAEIDEEGYVYLVDRKKDLIISGGFNIYPREVEEALYTHPAIAEVAVIGVSDKEWGEVVKAVVVLKEGLSTSAEELMAFCRERVGFKRPKLIEFTSQLPKNAIGKVDKKLIKSLYGGI